MSDISTLKKYNIILEEFNLSQDKTLTAYSEALSVRLELGPKQILRLLRELEMEYDAIVTLEGKKRETFKLIRPVDLFVETFEQTDQIDWFFQMAHDADPEIFKELASYTNQNKNIYKFVNTPFEDMEKIKENGMMKKLESAIKLREYRKITFANLDTPIDNVRCLKLVFIDNNWYLANVADDDILRLSRVSFIENVNYASNLHSFQNNSVKKQMDFLDNNLQNSLTLYGVDTKTAVIKASPSRAKYFDEGMKKFLSTQKFKDKHDDGSVIFTLEYTQPLEILPFIQSWLPHLTILEPQELKDEYKKNLNQMLQQ